MICIFNLICIFNFSPILINKDYHENVANQINTDHINRMSIMNIFKNRVFLVVTMKLRAPCPCDKDHIARFFHVIRNLFTFGI